MARKPKATQKKPKTTTRGTDEAFLKLMKVSGSSLLKLFGVPVDEAESYSVNILKPNLKLSIPN